MATIYSNNVSYQLLFKSGVVHGTIYLLHLHNIFLLSWTIRNNSDNHMFTICLIHYASCNNARIWTEPCWSIKPTMNHIKSNTTWMEIIRFEQVQQQYCHLPHNWASFFFPHAKCTVWKGVVQLCQLSTFFIINAPILAPITLWHITWGKNKQW
jgi:hypothetical protein